MKTSIFAIFVVLAGINGEEVTESAHDGKNRQRRVIAGENANITSFPFFASLESRCGGLLGGGSIISRNFVLTAAHVLYYLMPSNDYILTESYPNDNSTDLYPENNSTESDQNNLIDGPIYQIADEPEITNPYKDLLVRVGSHLREEGGSIHEVDLVIIHPNYVHNDSVGGCINDIALARVVYSFIFDNFRQPIQLFDAGVSFSDRVGTKVSVVGLGYTEKGMTHHLRNTTIWIANKTKCENVYRNKKQVPLPKSAFCAGGGGGTRDTCSGDSGGPLVIEIGNPKVKFQAGITSFAKATCGKPNVPALYTEVSLFRSWIESHVTLP
ncbi:hypothetical protein QAD02_015601 [Eretmocerus hayati]|uniref:Uncharacterized protein n=1 Tax=Eretmocerus hayati TaxID=131215 RepID=A0ACC2P946_9HYME|nr:hypothetical protein QAD02_015601 [Eretmocerus hayati]